MSVEVEMRPGRPGQHRVGAGDDGDLGSERFEVDQRQLGVGLADVDDGDVSTGHGMWKTVSSGTDTGSLSALVSMMSAMWAHHFRITG